MNEFVSSIAVRQHFDSVDDFYAAIGYGGVALSKLMQRIKDDYQKIIKPAEALTPAQMIEKAKEKSTNGVVVEGIDNCPVKFAACCNPLPGDDIIGYITRGHRCFHSQKGLRKRAGLHEGRNTAAALDSGAFCKGSRSEGLPHHARHRGERPQRPFGGCEYDARQLPRTAA